MYRGYGRREAQLHTLQQPDDIAATERGQLAITCKETEVSRF
jgi:hypothetical protein